MRSPTRYIPFFRLIDAKRLSCGDDRWLSLILRALNASAREVKALFQRQAAELRAWTVGPGGGADRQPQAGKARSAEACFSLCCFFALPGNPRHESLPMAVPA